MRLLSTESHFMPSENFTSLAFSVNPFKTLTVFYCTSEIRWSNYYIAAKTCHAGMTSQGMLRIPVHVRKSGRRFYKSFGLLKYLQFCTVSALMWLHCAAHDIQWNHQLELQPLLTAYYSRDLFNVFQICICKNHQIPFLLFNLWNFLFLLNLFWFHFIAISSRVQSIRFHFIYLIAYCVPLFPFNLFHFLTHKPEMCVLSLFLCSTVCVPTLLPVAQLKNSITEYLEVLSDLHRSTKEMGMKWILEGMTRSASTRGHEMSDDRRPEERENTGSVATFINNTSMKSNVEDIECQTCCNDTSSGKMLRLCVIDVCDHKLLKNYQMNDELDRRNQYFEMEIRVQIVVSVRATKLASRRHLCRAGAMKSDKRRRARKVQQLYAAL